MRKKNWLFLALIIALITLGAWLWWRAPSSSLKEEAQQLKPELSVASLNIYDIDDNKISAVSNVILKNNLPIEVKTSHLNYVVYIDSTKIIESSYNKPITIHSSDSTAIKLPMEIMHKKMAAVLKRFESRKIDSADYSVKATFQVEVPIAGERYFTMHMLKRLPALRLLKAKLKDIDIGKVGFKESSLDMVLNVENPNAFPVRMKDGKYKLSIDDDINVMEGVIEKVVSIPAYGLEAITMHVDMKTMKVPKLGWKMLFMKKNTHFKMNFSCKLMSDNEVLNNSKMAFNMQGTLDEMKNAIEKD